MARVLVTGGGGFLGSAISEALAARGDAVIAFDVAIGPGLQRLAETHARVTPVVGELTEWPHLAAALAEHRPDQVVHCAAIVGVPASVGAPLATMRVNVEGSLNLFEAMRLAGIRRVVHLSSEEVYGPFTAPRIDEDHPCRPLMAYGISKLAVEQLGRSYGRLYGLECINVRTCWVYGPGLPRPRVPKTLVDAALAGRPLHLPAGGDFRVDHVYVADAVQGVLLALDQAAHAHDVYNIATGQAPSLAEIVTIIKDLVPGAELSVGPGDYRFDERIGPVPKGALDITRARQHLGYAPRYDIRAGLAAYLDARRRGEA
jgi:nucleoside-diphosphate-sugar epimerase